MDSIPIQSPFINPNNTFKSPTPHKHKQAMENFKNAVMKIANTCCSDSKIIEQHLSKFFADFHTPEHPPYAAMIHRAIGELKERGGSSEESISNYIKEKYDDLPWAHLTMLKHHLGKLCDCEEIFLTRKGCYSLNSFSSSRTKKEQLKRKRRLESGKRRHRGRKKYKNKEENLMNRQCYRANKENLEDERYQLKNSQIDILSKQEKRVSADAAEENQPERRQNDVNKEVYKDKKIDVIVDEIRSVYLANEVGQEEQRDISALIDLREPLPELPHPEKSLHPKPNVLEVKHRGKQKWMKSQLKEMVNKDVVESSEKIEQEQLLKSLGAEKSPENKFETVESLSEKKQQAIEISEGNETSESQTERQQRQMRRWSQRKSAPNPAITSVVEVCSTLLSLNQHPIQEEFLIPKMPKQTMGTESTQINGQRLKLRSWQNRNTSYPETLTDSIGPEQQPQVPSPETSLKELFKPLSRKLRPRRSEPEPEPVTAAITRELLQSQSAEEQKKQPEEQQGQGCSPKPKPDTGVEKSTCFDHKNQQEQEQSVKRTRGRPPKSQLTKVTIVTALFSSNSMNISQKNQQQDEEGEPEYRGRGRPPKLKPDTAVGESTYLDNQNQPEQKQEQSALRTRGRPSKLQLEKTTSVEELFSSNSPDISQKDQQRDEKEDQQEYRGRGRHNKRRKVDASSRTSSTLNKFMRLEKPQQQPKSRGLGRPPKMD